MAAAQAVPRLSGADPRSMDDWSRRYIEQEDWTRVGRGDRTVWFVSSLPVESSGSPLIQDWIRAEDGGVKDGGVYSSLIRVEVDCRNQSSRIVELIHFQENNLRGRFFVSDTPTSTMEPSKPDSIARSYIKAICAGTK
jgi:hypothetical protein